MDYKDLIGLLLQGASEEQVRRIYIFIRAYLD